MLEAQDAAQAVRALRPYVDLIGDAHMEHDLRSSEGKFSGDVTETHANARVLPHVLVAHHRNEARCVEEAHNDGSTEENATDEVIFPCLSAEHRLR